MTTGLMADGLLYVGLREKPGEARAMAERQGRPRVLLVDAARMHAAGHAFYRVTEGLWLTARVPVECMTLTPEKPQP